MSIRLRRGTDAERAVATLAEGELIYTTDLKEVWVGDGSALGGLKVVGDELLSVAVVSYQNTDARFFGELGSPLGQGWIETAAASDIVQESVFGSVKNVVRLNDDDGSNYKIESTLTAQDWQNIFDYGATYSGTSRLDTDNGANGFYIGLQTSTADNPDLVNTGGRRYGVSMQKRGDYLVVGSPDISSEYVLDDTAATTVLHDEWFTYEVIIPPGLGPANVYINNVLIPYQSTFEINAGAGGTQVTVGSGSTSGTNRVTYHDHYGVTIYEESSTKIMSNADLLRENVFVLIPTGRRDYTLTFPNDTIDRKIGDTISIDAQNVHGTLSFVNEDSITPKVLVNGLSTNILVVPKPTNINLINTVVGNTYVYTPIDYREDIVNDKDFAITGNVSSGTLTVSGIHYPTIDGSASRYVVVTDGAGNLSFSPQDGSFEGIIVNDRTISYDGKFGTPAEQGWIDASTGGSRITTDSEVVFGITKTTVEFDDSATDGVAATYIDLSATDWQELYTYGGKFTVIADLSTITSTASEYITFALRVALADSPVPGETEDKEYTFSIGRNATDLTSLELTFPEGAVTFDGTGAYPAVEYANVYHTYTIDIPPGLGAATVSFDDTDLGMPTSMVLASESSTRIFAGTTSDIDTSKVYVSEQSLEIYSDDEVVYTITDDIEYNNLMVVTPSKPKNYTFVISETLANMSTGASIVVVANNVGGTITGRGEAETDSLITFDGSPSFTAVVDTESIYIFTNVSNDGKTLDLRSTNKSIASFDDVLLTNLRSNDVLMWDGTHWVNSSQLYKYEYGNIDARFFGELGLPSQQQWSEEVSGVATVNLVQDTVFGVDKQVVQSLDDGSGINTLFKPLTAEDFQNVFDYGATYSGTARLDTTDGASGFFCSLGVKSGQSPLGDGIDRRYGLMFSQSNGFLRLSFTDSINGNSAFMNMDGATEAVTVAADEWFDFEVIVPPGLSDANVYINDVQLSLQCPFGGTGGGDDRTSALISSGSNSGTNRVSYHDNYGVTIYTSTSSKLLTNDELNADNIDIVIPPGRRDYTLTFPTDPAPRSVGDTVNVTLQNVNGTFTLNNESPLSPSMLANGRNEYTLTATKKETVTFLNVTDNNNIYEYTPSDYTEASSQSLVDMSDVSSSTSPSMNSILAYNELSKRFEFVHKDAVTVSDSRPTDPTTGQQFYDTKLGHPIWWNGNHWVNAMGRRCWNGI